MEPGSAQPQSSSIERAANRWAQAAVALIIVVGLVLIGLEAIHSRPAPLGSPSAKTTTTDISETRTTATGQTETTKKLEIATTSEDFVDRILGRTGPWFLRVLLVVLAAFLTGAAVQRVILGRFAVKVAGVLEFSEVLKELLPPTEEVPQLPDRVQEALHLPASAAEAADQSKIRLTGSHVTDVLNEIKGVGPAAYAIVDLEIGRSWLTTRLFIVAILLKRMRSLKTFVFVESREGLNKRFIGVVAPDVLRWALAREYPWLEDAYAEAYSRLPNHRILSESGTLDAFDAGLLVQFFLESGKIQSNVPGAAGEWEQLAPETWEHGHWVGRGLLARLVGVSPMRSSVVDVGDLTPQARALNVLAREGSFVALVDDKGGFRSLVDRKALLEELAARLVSVSTVHWSGVRGISLRRLGFEMKPVIE